MAGETSTADKGSERTPAADFIEYLGDTEHGTMFLGSHTILKGDALWKRNGVEDAKTIHWERDPFGPLPGHGKARMLVRVDAMSAAQVAVLEKTPGYKRVSE